jgi:hypothetical protein
MLNLPVEKKATSGAKVGSSSIGAGRCVSGLIGWLPMGDNPDAFAVPTFAKSANVPPQESRQLQIPRLSTAKVGSHVSHKTRDMGHP